jgi:hypothetical protein
MNWVKFSVAVILTSAALTLGIFATGAVLVGNALASTVPNMAQWHDHTGQFNQDLPPELASLKDIPAGQRFAHFKGVQVSLTDKDGKPIQLSVTPGVATSVTSTSVTIAGNDGASHTYSMDDKTLKRGATLANGQDVVVVTMNDTSAARAVVAIDPNNTNWHN